MVVKEEGNREGERKRFAHLVLIHVTKKDKNLSKKEGIQRRPLTLFS